jgi:alkyl hydroperoxide reductase subunit AhpC/predicted Ser/Thr protein kinase
MMVASVGQRAPDFSLVCISAEERRPRRVTLRDYQGRWLLLFFYPRDFSFVCPTELTAFSARRADFDQRDCELLGVSVDSIELHEEWLAAPVEQGGLGPLRFPLASDPQGDAARAYGVWVEEKKVSARGLFIIDPEGILQYAVVHNLSVGRSSDEVLRVLDALRAGGLCPMGWTSADGLIDPEQALAPGKILGHYRIRAKLGSGTFGTVFGAWDLHLERMVALKVMKQDLVASREAILAEARAAAGLNHPHICTVYAVEQEEGLPVIAMEYLAGRPLSQHIADGLPAHRALAILHQVALGLAAAHARGTVHGDLKPANIMVSDDGVAKILDFGLSTVRASQRDSSEMHHRPEQRPASDLDGDDATFDFVMERTGEGSSEPGSLRGTPVYMAPEQVTGEVATPASDVYSFGLVFFEALTGKRARRGRHVLQLLATIETEDLTRTLPSRVDAAYRDLLSSLLRHDPADRPAMTEVANQLATFV